jgi:hypothetical protein
VLEDEDELTDELLTLDEEELLLEELLELLSLEAELTDDNELDD